MIDFKINFKKEAHTVVDSLDKNANWSDLMYEVYVRSKIEEGLEAIQKGQIISHEEAKKRLLSG